MPNNIGNLNSLEYLDLSHNKREKIPETIGNLPSLKDN